jgi:hypothetical protein
LCLDLSGAIEEGLCPIHRRWGKRGRCRFQERIKDGMRARTSKERCGGGLGVSRIIVSKFHKREERKPIVLMIGAVRAKVLFQELIDDLGRTIRLRMMGAGKIDQNT